LGIEEGGNSVGKAHGFPPRGWRCGTRPAPISTATAERRDERDESWETKRETWRYMLPIVPSSQVETRRTHLSEPGLLGHLARSLIFRTRRSLSTIMKSRHSRRAVPMRRSQKAFAMASDDFRSGRNMCGRRPGSFTSVCRVCTDSAGDQGRAQNAAPGVSTVSLARARSRRTEIAAAAGAQASTEFRPHPSAYLTSTAAIARASATDRRASGHASRPRAGTQVT